LRWFVNDNRRAALRRGYNNNAWIRLGGSLARECQVVDLSRTGVRLTVTNADSLPETFILLLSKGSTGRPARVKWRRGTQVGAEFITANASLASRSTADAPRANSSSASRLTADAPKANSPSARRFNDGAPTAANATRGESQGSEKSIQARGQVQQQDPSN